jgi:hypothetical protein
MKEKLLMPMYTYDSENGQKVQKAKVQERPNSGFRTKPTAQSDIDTFQSYSDISTCSQLSGIILSADTLPEV